MDARRVLTLAGRIIRQFRRDRRTVALLLIVPVVALGLAAILIRSGVGVQDVGVVNLDAGVVTPGGRLSVGDQIVEALATTDGVRVTALKPGDEEGALRSGRAAAAITLPADLSVAALSSHQVHFTLFLEGSSPSESASLAARVNRATLKALTGVLAGVTGASAEPLNIDTHFLYGGPQYTSLDYMAPVFIPLFVFLLTFLLTSLSFQRERAQGTIERLLATPVTRGEIVLGYMLGFMLFALAQSAWILLFTVFVLQIHYAGSLLVVFVTEVILTVAAVNLGIFLSTYARSEFQVVQMYIVVVITQAFLSGTFAPIASLPRWLRPLSHLMPLTYANWGLRDVMIRGRGILEVAPYLLVLVGFAAVLVVAGALTVQREVA